MRIAIGCDEAAFQLKEIIRQLIESKGHEVRDFGTYDAETKVLYPDIGFAVATCIQRGECERGILICGTGIGMSISANKVDSIRAAVCHDIYSTRRSVLSNNCQIMCMGSRVIGPETAKSMVEEWLTLNYIDGPSTEKIDRITEYEHKTLTCS